QKNPQAVHKMNSFASPTALLANDRLYCCFGAYGSVCIDTSTGEKVWENTDVAIQHENGPGSTPVLWENRYILHCDGTDEQYIVALDTTTGKTAWRTPRSGKMEEHPQLRKAYGTPLLLQQDAETVIASPAANWVYGYDPGTGNELWKVAYGDVGFSTVPRPVAGNGLLYVVTGFMQGKLLALRLGDDLHTTPSLVWSFDKQIPNISSPLLAGASIYFVSDAGIVTCLHAEEGKLRWRERIGGNFVASPLHADGKIYLFSREGLTTVLSDTGEFSVLAKNSLEGEILASPAAVGKSIFIRTDKAIYRLETR
ncbi:MAG: PQQ-binding-like beta-propeller repeat protein, partial [Planctomycetota bacterium]|nr:PQQ-binding-like beta-propeller repeat protein [Planctomycetota bacterium]